MLSLRDVGGVDRDGALGSRIPGGQRGLGLSILSVGLAGVDAVLALVQEPEQPSRFDVGLGTDAELGQDYGSDGVRTFGDDFRGRRVEPFVRPALEDGTIRFTKGASTCVP